MEIELQEAIYKLYLAPRVKRLHLVWDYRYNEMAMDMLIQGGNLARKQQWKISPWSAVQWKIWYEKSYAYREEVSNRQTGFLIFDDGRVQEYFVDETGHPHLHLRPGKSRIEEWIAQHTLLRPRCLLASHQIIWRNMEVKLGNAVFHVEARNVSGGMDNGCCFDEWFWGGAEKYHLWIDRETGILLQYTAEADETIIAVAEVRKIETDFSKSVFFNHR